MEKNSEEGDSVLTVSYRRLRDKVKKSIGLVKNTDRTRVRFGAFVVLVSLLCAVVVVTIAQVQPQQNVTSYGKVKVIGVSLYWDKNCTNPVTTLTWGTITPGASVNRYVYVKNEGNSAGTLSMSYGSWTPASAVQYITLSWNCSSYVLSGKAVVGARLTLTIRSDITDIMDFNFIITIQAAG